MRDKTTQANTGGLGKLLFLVSGIVKVAIGLTGSIFGSAWRKQVYEFLFGFKFIESIDAADRSD